MGATKDLSGSTAAAAAAGGPNAAGKDLGRFGRARKVRLEREREREREGETGGGEGGGGGRDRLTCFCVCRLGVWFWFRPLGGERDAEVYLTTSLLGSVDLD